ncbi:MAG: hypothetical protein AAGC85_15730 [Bacteroidota bacterium]
MPDDKDIDWKSLLNEIERSKCVLIIGPDLLTRKGEPSFQQQLKAYLEEKLERKMPYYSEDEFFSFETTRQKRTTYNEIEEYFQEKKPETIHKKLAEIPFHLILNLSPDLRMWDAFKEKDFSHKFAFYKKGVNPEPVEPPTGSVPLLYNLLGAVEDKESKVGDIDSLIFSYDDLFKYLSSILGSKDLPDELRTALQEANHLVFLGIQYEKWYSKLLLWMLAIDKEKATTDKPIEASLRVNIAGELEHFYKEHFKEIKFVEREADAFVDQLYLKCQEAGILRVSGKEWKFDLLKQVSQAIAANKPEEALQILQEYISIYRKDLLSEVSLLQGRQSGLRTDVMSNVLSYQQADIQQSKINKAILSLAEKALQASIS